MNTSKNLQWKRPWQDALVGVLGAWFAASPWLLQLEQSVPVVATSLALGLALVLLAIGAFVAPRRWEHWAEAGIGIGIAASPWLLRFAEDAVTWRNAVAVGLVSALLALWVMVREREGKDAPQRTGELAH